MKQKQFGAESPVDGKVDQGSTKKNKPSNGKAIDPAISLPKKRNGNSPVLSPIQQVMKAVTAAAINPKKKKAPKKTVLNGPSSQNSEHRHRVDKKETGKLDADGDYDGESY